MIAVAMMGPMPGIAANRWLTASAAQHNEFTRGAFTIVLVPPSILARLLTQAHLGVGDYDKLP